MFRPGYITPEQANLLNEMLAGFRSFKALRGEDPIQVVQGQVPVVRQSRLDRVPVLISGVSSGVSGMASGTLIYNWNEQTFTESGLRVNKAPGMSGLLPGGLYGGLVSGAVYNPLFEVNDTDLSSKLVSGASVQSWAVRRGQAGAFGQAWEFAAQNVAGDLEPPTIVIPLVRSLCLTRLDGASVTVGTPVNLTVNSSWQDIATATIEKPGMYVVGFDLRGTMEISAVQAGSTAFIMGRLFNETTSQVVPNTETMIIATDALNDEYSATGSCRVPICVPGDQDPTTLKLQARRCAGTCDDGATVTFTKSQIDSNANGYSRLVIEPSVNIDQLQQEIQRLTVRYAWINPAVTCEVVGDDCCVDPDSPTCGDVDCDPDDICCLDPADPCCLNPDDPCCIDPTLPECDEEDDGTIATACCPNLIQETLYATVAGAGGGMDGTYAMVWNGTNWKHTSSDAFGTCPGGLSRDIFVLNCNAVSGVWTLTFPIAFGSPTPASPSDCGPPLDLTFPGLDFSSCGGASSVTVLVGP